MAATLMRRVYLIAALVCISACTDLRVINRAENETVPWYEISPRWESNSYSATTKLVNGALSIVSSIPHKVEDCLSQSLGEAVCQDLDEDGLVDEWETIVSHRLNPVIRYHKEEPLFTDARGRVQGFSRVVPVAGDRDRVHVFLVHTYSYDYGRCSLERHRGDLERVAFEVTITKPTNESVARVEAAYTAAHEYTSFDVSAIYRGDQLSGLEYAIDPVTNQPRWVIYASTGKHASYASRGRCVGRSTLPCARESCASAEHAYELLFPMIHVGEPNQTGLVWWQERRNGLVVVI